MFSLPLHTLKQHSLLVLKGGFTRLYTTQKPNALLCSQKLNTGIPYVSCRYHGDSHGMDDPLMQTKEMKHITYVGLGMNVVLTATKAVLGFVMNSSSVIADAVHSLSDMISDVVTLGTVSYSRRPPNKKWIYGYGKLESMASLVVSGILIGTAGAVFVFTSLCFPSTVTEVTAHVHSHSMMMDHNSNNILNGMGIGVLVASIGMKEWLYQKTMNVAKQTDSSVLKANAWHHRVDALTAVVALVGLSGRFIGIPWLDPIGGAAVGAVVLKTGWDVGWKSLAEVVDLSVDDNTLALIRKEASEGIPSAFTNRVVVDSVLARKAGPHIHSVVRLRVSEDIPLNDVLSVKQSVEEELHHIHNLQSVVIDISRCFVYCQI